MPEQKVIVIGDANVDIIVPYPKFLNQERTLVDYPNPCLQGGGTSANTAVALSRLGVQTGFVGSVGDDQYGRFIQKDFAVEKVDTSQLIVEPNLNTVGVFAFIDETGERYLWGWPRVEQAFKIMDDEKVNHQEIMQASWIHSSGMALVHDSSARETILKVFKEAYEAGVTTSFDLNLRVDNGELEASYKEIVLEMIRYSNYVLGSASDEFAYLGESENAIRNAKTFVTDNRTVIVRMGKEGSVGISSTEEVLAKAFPVTVVDTVGAGDVYNAGFISACLEGKSLAKCLEIGNAVSGYTVGQKGSRNCPYKKELEDFIRKHKAL